MNPYMHQTLVNAWHLTVFLVSCAMSAALKEKYSLKHIILFIYFLFFSEFLYSVKRWLTVTIYYNNMYYNKLC